MADTSGVDNLTSTSNGSTSLAGIKAAVDNLNTAKQEKGSAVTGNIAAFGSSNVLEDTGKVVPSGTIVGTTDTQTMTNKTLTAPTITSPTTTGTDNGTQTLLNKIINAALNTISNISEAMLALTDVTTGNVSSTAHGFAPKTPNDATQFLNGTGAWSKPGLSFKNLQTTYVTSTGTGTQTIAHGLGKTPAFVRISAKVLVSSGSMAWSDGSYNGSANSNSYAGTTGTAFTTAGGDNTNIINLQMGTSTNVVAVCTVDATNIYLAWTKTGSPSSTASLEIEVTG